MRSRDEQKARDFDYYEALTVRDSSLSACTQAVIAAEVGHLELAYDYFGEAALMDLHDLEHNTRDGVHIASLAGAWIAAVAGFGGMRDHGGKLSFAPRLPARLERLALPARLPRPAASRSSSARRTRAYSLFEGERARGASTTARRLPSTAEGVARAIPPAPERAAPTQPPGRAPVRRRTA